MNRYEVKPWIAWGRASRIKLGGWYADGILESIDWFFKDCVRQGRRTVNYIKPTPEFMAIKDRVLKDSELFAPLAWPMLIEPNDWGDKPGGYLLNEVMHGHEMVRRGHQGRIQGETPTAFLNKIQKVGYKINQPILNVASW